MVDYISTTQDVRELSRSVPISEWPDSEIIEEQKAAYNYISIYLHKSDWTSTDFEYPAVQKAETQLASVYIKEHYKTSSNYDKIEQEKMAIKEDLDNIKDNMESLPVDEDNILTRTDYQSWILNPDLSFISKLDGSLRSSTASDISD